MVLRSRLLLGIIGHMGVVAMIRRVSLQWQLIVAVVLSSALAVVLSGALVFILQERSIRQSTHAHLSRIRGEITVLASEGINSSTGQPFATPRELLYQHLQSQVLGHTEGAVGFLDGLPRLIPHSTDIHPEKDAELIRAVEPLVSDSRSLIDTISTPTSTYMVLVVPIAHDQQPGALLHVVDLNLATQDLRQSMLFYFLASGFVLIAVILAARPVVRRLLSPIEELRSAAESIDEHDLTSRVPVRSHDDLGVLATAFNTMLDRVERSVQAQRDLLDDVGHELRTPITVVRGHLEVVDPSDPNDVAEVKELSIDELDRMAALVNDMLMLAKSADVDFVTPVPTDIADLTEAVLTKAQALGKRDWVLDSTAPIQLTVDSSRLTQAWLQLAHNAVKYSAEGTTIHLGSRIEDGAVTLWVADEGIGISPEDLPRIRERFVRGRTAHSHSAGSGLGLSIVDTIMRAHSATMNIESTLGKGTRVTMRLPLPTDTLRTHEAPRASESQQPGSLEADSAGEAPHGTRHQEKTP